MNAKRMPSAVRSNRRHNVDGRLASSYILDNTTRTCEKQDIRASTGRIVGEVREGIFYKTVRESKHLLRAPRGWASDISVLDQLEARGVERMCLTDVESGKRYRATVRDFRRHGIALNRGFGPQLVLPLAFWKTTQPGQPQVVQLAFAGVGL